MKYLRNHWTQQSWLTPAPSRKSVEDMLLANGCRKPKSKAVKKGHYYPAVKRYFPHAQTVLDGKEVLISLGGNEYKFTLEYSKDMAADAIGGYSVGRTETSGLVKQAFDDHCRNHQKPLAALLDNGPGNGKAAIDLGGEGVLVIKAYPYHPQTKGQIEGEFGMFEKKVSHIFIDGKDEKHQAIKKQQTEQRLNISQQVSDLAESVVKEHGLSGDLLRFKQSLKWIELATIREAEFQFPVQSGRDNFDEGKRTMAYFYAIARNLQQQKDTDRKEIVARRRYGLDQKSRQHRAEIRARIAEQKQKKEQPQRILIEAIKAEMALPPDFRDDSTIFKEQMTEGIQSILKRKKQNRQHLFNQTFAEIMALSDYSLETRYGMIKHVKKQINLLT